MQDCEIQCFNWTKKKKKIKGNYENVKKKCVSENLNVLLIRGGIRRGTLYLKKKKIRGRHPVPSLPPTIRALD